MANSTPSIDTNIILRLLLDDVPAQREAVLGLLARYNAVEVADLAITETVFVLERVLEVPREEVVAVLRSLLANQHMRLNRVLLEHVIPEYLAHPAVSFNDCCLAAYAELNGATPLFTFDKNLARQLVCAELPER